MMKPFVHPGVLFPLSNQWKNKTVMRIGIVTNIYEKISFCLRNREGNISTFEIIFLLAIHRHHDVLLVANGVSGRDRTRHAGQLVFPQYFSCLLIKRTEHVVGRGADEDQASCGSNSAAAVERPGIWNAHLFKFR